MTFDYMQRVVIDAQLEVEDIGNCIISARNDVAEEFYLLIKTELGWTEIIEYGPCLPDLEILPFYVSQTYQRIEFNQGKICSIIQKFLNNPKRLITQAEVTELDEIKDFIRNPLHKVYNL